MELMSAILFLETFKPETFIIFNEKENGNYERISGKKVGSQYKQTGYNVIEINRK